MEQRPAPVVSISDPARPGTPGDVLSAGGERDPWRPRGWQLKAVALAVALTLAAVVPGKVVQARAQDRRAATAAAEAVQLTLRPGRTANVLEVAVSNDGPAAVRLLDVQVDGPGYRRVTATGEIASRDVAEVTLADTRTCREDLLEAGSTGSAEVRVRTPAGRVVRRMVPVGADTWAALVGAAQKRCGYLPPEQALTTTAVLARRGNHFSVRLRLHNAGRVPLALGSLNLLGYQLTADPQRALPLEIPPGATRELTASSSLPCNPSGAFEGGGPTTTGLVLQVLPVLQDGSGVLATVQVQDPAVDRQVAAIPRCSVNSSDPQVVTATAG